MPELPSNTAMPTVIERAIPVDIPALVDLMNAFHAESSYGLDRKWAEASFERLLGDEQRGAAWLARQGKQSAGYVVLTLSHSMEFGGLAGVIDDLFVRPQFRRQRVGSALVSALFDACRTLHVAAIHVEVSPDNVGALALYQSFGLRGYSVERQTLTAELGMATHAGASQ
jgi:ribosomal protein S18 acetylase RimI-like enzyme